MSSVSEQIHAYQALKAEQGHAVRADADILAQPVKPSDFFKNLMLRWQRDSVQDMARRRQDRPQ